LTLEDPFITHYRVKVVGWTETHTRKKPMEDQTPRVKHPRKKHYDQVISCSASIEEVVKVDALADLEGTSRSAIVRRALTAYLRQSPDRKVAA